MKLQPQPQAGAAHSHDTASASAITSCRAAKEFEETGDRERARECLSNRWERIGERPSLEGLDRQAAAEVLLCVGYLASRIGMRQRVAGAQEFARDLLTEAAEIFESLGMASKAAEARDFLAVCYWREGRFDTAALILQEALERLGDSDDEQRAILIKDLAINATSALRHDETIEILAQAAPLFHSISNDSTLGKYHQAYGVALKVRWAKTHVEDDLDRALEKLTAASIHFQRARLSREQAMAENNLGNLLAAAGRFPEAHEHVERAVRIYRTLKEEVLAADTEQSRAEIYLSENKNAEAEATARSAVRVLELASEKDLYARALVTWARSLARLERFGEALTAFALAFEAAAQVESPDTRTSVVAACLEETSAHALVETGMKRKELALLVERGIFARALALNGGGVSHAAAMLGMSHQNFAGRLQSRHPELQGARKPAVPRRHTVINERPTGRNKSVGAKTRQGRTRLHLVSPAETVDALIELPPGLPADGQYLTIRLGSDRLIELGISKGCWAVVLLGEAGEGDPAAVRELADGPVYSVGYLFREGGEVRLEPACPECPTVVFEESEVIIEGPIVARCEIFDVSQARGGGRTGFRLKALPLSPRHWD